jgi:tRNA(fMet)-specific endonuclease VapC
MNYLLDTNIVLIYTRGSALAEEIDNKYNLFDSSNDLYISVVTVAELKSIIIQRNYGEKKIRILEDLMQNFSIIDINITEILDRYAEIDAYSQGKLMGKKGDFTARNMGKNDLFIAATSSVYDLILITTDNDFNHLTPEYIKVEKIDIEKFKK